MPHTMLACSPGLAGSSSTPISPRTWYRRPSCGSELRDALSSIGVQHRDAVVETVLRDRSYADVAAELGVPAGTVRTRVHYGLRRLRCVLQTSCSPPSMS